MKNRFDPARKTAAEFKPVYKKRAGVLGNTPAQKSELRLADTILII